MKRLIAVMCFLLAATPYAMAQDKSKADAKKAPVAAEKSAKADAPKGKADARKSAKKEPSEKQKAQQARMSACSKEAKDKNMKGDERRKFMKECLKRS